MCGMPSPRIIGVESTSTRFNMLQVQDLSTRWELIQRKYDHIFKSMIAKNHMTEKQQNSRHDRSKYLLTSLSVDLIRSIRLRTTFGCCFELASQISHMIDIIVSLFGLLFSSRICVDNDLTTV